MPGQGELPETPPSTCSCTAEQARLDHAAPGRALGGRRRGLGRRSAARCPRRTRAGAQAEALLADGVNAESIGALRVGARRRPSCSGPSAWSRRSRPWRAWYRVDLLPAPSRSTSTRDAEALEAYALTAREREVLAALAAGHTNKEIADALFISVKTASVHVSNILRKLDVQGRQEAARVAHRLGVSPADTDLSFNHRSI